VLSQFTAFIGVEERDEAVESSMIRHVIPVGLRSTRGSAGTCWRCCKDLMENDCNLLFLQVGVRSSWTVDTWPSLVTFLCAHRGCMTTGRRYQVMNVVRSKTGKHGSAKAFVEAIDPETGKKVSHVLPAHQLTAVR
jgi:hypothetical protein